MKTLADTQNGLKTLLPEGIDVAIKGIKEAISKGTDKYNDLLLIEGRYQDISRQLIQGTLSDEASQLEFNKIRKDLLDFIDSLQEVHLAEAEKKGVDGKPDIYNGEVLYRIPKQMQKDEETKCLVRLAFDRAIITQDLEKQEGDVMKDLRISEVMGVELLDMAGNAFQIRTLHDTVQFVEKDLYTEWLFYVKPILEGIHPLVLKISIIEIKDGIERKRNVVLEEKVEIISTVPEKSGVAEEFAKAGIALTVAGSQQDGGGGLEELPQPRPKASDTARPAPAPTPAPATQRSGTSFRKIASVLSAFVVLIVASWAIWNNVSPNPSDIKPNDLAEEDHKAWDRIKDNPTLLDIRAFLEKYPKSDWSHRARGVLDSLDQEAWQSALASNDLNRLKQYRNQFPEGRFTDEAATMIKDMESGIAQETGPETEKPAPVPTKPIKEKDEPKYQTNEQNPNNDEPPKTDTAITAMDTDNQIETPQPEKPTPIDPNEPIPMRLASRLPIYPGCKNDDQQQERACTNKSIGRFVKKNLNYPQEARRMQIEGTVTVQFVVEKDGRVTGAQFKNDIGGGCAKEAVRLVQKLPNFEPGLNRIGQPARIKYLLPIRFDLH